MIDKCGNMPETTSIPKLEKEILDKMMADCSKKASEALSEMINLKVNMTSTSLNILPINDVPKLLNPEDVSTVLLYTKLSGLAYGTIIISAPSENILRMADIFLHKPKGYFRDFSAENVSVIKELANIIAGYYITALNHLLRTTYASSDIALSINPRRAIEEFGFGSIYTEDIPVLMLKASLEIEGGIKEDATILFKKKDISKIMERVSDLISNIQFA